MAGRSVSGYVDEKVAERLNDVARAESRTPANIVGLALSFYVDLPEAARASLRRIETIASPEEMSWFKTEFVRLLFKVDMGLAQSQMAREIGANIPNNGAEEELEKTAIDWTSNFGR